ncbi:MAG TPA: four-carbon acid sugar kinase family protein [Devosia sp.]|nr:four-carbon acid sugar kinase family protein [Devosia sp.]
MPLLAVVIADDLTGALDTATPFALAGMSVAAALTAEAAERALACNTDVVVVNTASRNLTPTAAVARMRALARAIGRHHPGLVLKKIDSRLKGNIAVEAEGLAHALGFTRAIVAPAVPDQGRIVLDGAVTGRGVGVPIPIAPLFAGSTLELEIVDTRGDSDLDALVAPGSHNWSTTLAIGARGLGAAFARRHGPLLQRPFPREEATLFSVGSRDPITAVQIQRLRTQYPDLTTLEVGSAGPAENLPGLPGLLTAAGMLEDNSERVSARLAEATAQQIAMLQPSTIVASGGDTALALLEALGVDLVFPEGEAAPGLPWFSFVHNAKRMRFVVKSGGFGQEDALAALLPSRAG